ncbi:calcium/calmodulin-regulated receptor-like kinase 1 isoform X5 [Canna indica]|uniref:Calcium/calmodulin-regulated receptor-like kinase 1 isoform X5 n=1 Tax=Canna indica TaxID=4628 RepID=A0AAQ3QK00_9LILI|nr:calcium/calmodulin-regulated receptor-like kinase 1 isoform X5 [Canna indica]
MEERRWPDPSGGSGKEEERERKKEKGPADSLLRHLEKEKEGNSSSSSNVVILACDATREHNELELRLTIDAIRMQGGILRGGYTLLVLGVLHAVTNPMGYQTKACTDSFGGTSSLALEDEVLKKVVKYECMLQQSAEKCKNEGVSINVKITAGTPAKMVVLQEVVYSKPPWVVLDRHLRRDLKFYLKHLSCKVASIDDSLCVHVKKHFVTNASNKGILDQKLFYSVWKVIQPSSDVHENDKEPNKTNVRSLISFADYYASMISQDYYNALKLSTTSSSTSRTQDSSLSTFDGTVSSSKQAWMSSSEHRSLSSTQALGSSNDTLFEYDSTEKPILCTACGLRTILYVKESMKFQFSEIQDATSNFSEENLLGEGGFGFVYKGQLKDGQIIAAKLHKEASTQGYAEFFSEVHVLSFARHRNIVMLLGYCCKENYNVLVYEYICNKSLHWHLFGKSANILEWHRRHAIAMGIAKGLRFLHEECRGGPIIHRDLRPSNILLTHDFVPMLCDFGLAKWKSDDDSFQTRVLGTSGYLAPEYAEFGIVSVRTDVYAFGVVLFQLISGRKVVDEENGHPQHLLQWAEPLVESLALHQLIDPRLGESYDTYELYHLARAAFLCVRRNPEMRPSMGEVVRLLEECHVRDLTQQFSPHYSK